MPPKPIISAVKGQQSLFSFFNKPAQHQPVSSEKTEEHQKKSTPPQTPSASSIINENTATANEFKSATTRDIVRDFHEDFTLFIYIIIINYYYHCWIAGF
jgi:hypothetical protein